jgi:hypothetical protein
MKPHVACIVSASIDGRTLLSCWSPDPSALRGLFERVHDEIGCDAWLIGRATGHEHAKREAYPTQLGTCLEEIFKLGDWIFDAEKVRPPS